MSVGAVQVTVACRCPGVAVTLRGCVGTVGTRGVTAFEGAEATLSPVALVATTVKV